MARKVMILAGAPEASSLIWDEAQLLNHFDTPFAAFTETCMPPPDTLRPGTNPDSVLWRSLPLRPAHLKTGFSQSHELYAGYEGDDGFFTTVSHSLPWVASGHSDEDSSAEITLSQFYDHSIAIHHDIPSSQLPAGSSSTHVSSFSSADPSSLASGFDDSTSDEPSLLREQRLARLGSAHLSDLEDLPNAKYLEAIQPQTMSVNLIATIISVAEPRLVKTRWGASKSLVELLLGDDTKAGFSVTFWLQGVSKPNHGHQAGAATTEDVVRNLRRQDVVLLRNVALGVFMNKVHGHSLRKDLTKVDLLYRQKLFVGDKGGLYSSKDINSNNQAHPQLLKARQVREWAINFVGAGPANHANKGRAGKRSVRSWELPPEDTQ